MRTLFLLLIITTGSLPATALADRGAVSIEGGGIVSAARIPPPVGTGDSVFGTMGGAALGVRYALRNDVELTLGGTWLDRAAFYFPDVTVPCGGACTGQLSTRIGRVTATAGADYVLGLTFRFHVGAEAGWAEVTFDRMQHSSGTPIPARRSIDGIIVAPHVGLEWAATDHLSFAITPRVDLLVGEPQLAFSVPFTASYSWYR